MKTDTMKKLTVGDMSGCNRSGSHCTVVRCSIGEIAVGEVAKIRFKDEIEVTPWRYYKLEEKHFLDKFDEERGRYTGTFARVPAPGAIKKGAPN